MSIFEGQVWQCVENRQRAGQLPQDIRVRHQGQKVAVRRSYRCRGQEAKRRARAHLRAPKQRHKIPFPTSDDFL
jgi:hypothetical protein